MNDVVIDASVTLAWLFEEHTQPEMLESRLHAANLVAPPLWRLEVVNALLIRERRHVLTPEQTNRFLQILSALEITILGEPKGRSMEQLALLARPHQLSAYDAVYLELALAEGRALWTLDHNLADAAARVGIKLIAVPGT